MRRHGFGLHNAGNCGKHFFLQNVHLPCNLAAYVPQINHVHTKACTGIFMALRLHQPKTGNNPNVLGWVVGKLWLTRLKDALSHRKEQIHGLTEERGWTSRIL